MLDALGRRAIPCDVTSPWSTELVLSDEYQRGLQREHLVILNAISAGDAEAARDAMRAHLSPASSATASACRPAGVLQRRLRHGRDKALAADSDQQCT